MVAARRRPTRAGARVDDGHPSHSGAPSAASAWQRSPCLGQCDAGSAALVLRAGRSRSASWSRRCASRCAGARHEPMTRPYPVLRTRRASGPARLLARVGKTDPTSLESYRAAGGYQALARAIELGPEGVIARSGRLAPAGPWRRGVSDRPQMGRSPPPGGDAPLRGLQRGRERARHVQGSRADRKRSVRGDRVDDHLRPRDRRAATASSTSAANIPWARRGCATPFASARAAGLLGHDVMGSGERSTSRSAAVAAPTSAARRRRSSTRSRASAESRGRSRRFPRRLACSVSQPSPTTWRRWSTCSTSFARAGRLGAHRHARLRRAPAVLPVGTRRAPGLYEVPFGATLQQLIDAGWRRDWRTARCRPSCSAAPPAVVRRARASIWTCRSLSKRRAPRAPRWGLAW